jgi:putative aldouronate transport system substrate-binding protein
MFKKKAPFRKRRVAREPDIQEHVGVNAMGRSAILGVFAGALSLFCGVALSSCAGGGRESRADSARVPTEITWFVNEGWFTREWDSLRPVDRVIEEETGVRVRFFNSAGGSSDTARLDAMMAANDLPDVISLGWWYPQFQQLMATGVLLPLNEAMPIKAPGLWGRVPESMKRWYTFDDGNWYGFAGMYWDTDQFSAANYLETNGAMVARKDIMADLGIEASDFDTQAGMANALKKVRASARSYRGAPIIPLYMTPNGGFPGTWVWDGFWALPREDAAGEYLFPWLQPKYLEQMIFANRLFREGLLAVENFTATREQIREKILSGAVFAMTCNIADYEAPMIVLTQTDPAAEYVAVGPVRAADGGRPYLDSTGLTGWLVSVISRETGKADQILALWDFLHSMPGQLLTTYGVEGETYRFVDGRVEWTASWIEAVNDTAVNAPELFGNHNLWFLQNPVLEQKMRPRPATAGEKMIRDIKTYFGRYTFDDTVFKSLDPSGATPEAAVWSEIQTYWEDQEIRMILASSEEDVKAVYDRSLTYVRRLGLAEVIAARRTAFRKNKERLGLDRAWPTVNE